MRYIVDSKVVNRTDLTLSEVLGLLFLKESYGIASFKSLEEKQAIINTGTQFVITEHYDDLLSKILLDSDAEVPDENYCLQLAERLRSYFPKGMKVGSAAWKGNKREVALRLQKFFKLYGNHWTDDEIAEATQKYVNSFNGDYQFMRILKYFILKNKTVYDENGVGHNEEHSELADWLDSEISSDANNTNWLTELR